MAIWIWIIAAWVLSYLVLRKKKVSFEHLIWILLPVDMYGIMVAGATIKPYMIFCLLLFIRLLLQRREKLVLNGWVYLSGFISGAIVLVNLINNQSTSAPKAALLLIVVWGCIVLYLLNCGKSTATDIPDVMIATGIGYGIVFLFGFILMKMGLELSGIVAGDRHDDGFFLIQYDVLDGVLISSCRLRGFTIDPNSMIGTFAFCPICCIMRIVKDKGSFREWIGLFLSGACVLLSNSRMGIICFIILAVITFVISYRLANTKAKNIIKLTILFLIGVLIVLLIVSDFIQDIVSDIVSLYDNRSGLNDEYGRFSIWKNAITVFFENNPLLGIGIGQMQNYTITERDCHNTWLRFICDNGVIVGSAICLLFLAAIIKGVNKVMWLHDPIKKDFCVVFLIGLLTVMLSLVSVDNITYSYLWFSAAMLTGATE